LSLEKLYIGGGVQLNSTTPPRRQTHTAITDTANDDKDKDKDGERKVPLDK
jgi:hypothetical protein